MEFINKHFVLRFFCFLMALHTLNLSVDAPDPQANHLHLREDLSLNQMESVLEVIFEQILGFEDAFPENEEDDSGQALIAKINLQAVYYQQYISIALLFSPSDKANLHENFLYQSPYSEEFHPEIIPPPPKA